MDHRLSTLDTLIHELTHRLEPRWNEAQVVLATKKLIFKMSEKEKSKWWKAYEQIKVVLKKPVEVTDEDDA